MNDYVYLIIYILIGFALSFIVMSIAENKGRRGGELFAFWLLGLFFTVIGLIIVLIIENKGTNIKPQIGAGKRMDGIYLVCNKCGAIVSETSKSCSNCGQVFEPKSEANNKPKYCSNCGMTLNIGDIFCTNCGHKAITS